MAIRKCPYCGAEIAANSPFCGVCGRKLALPKRVCAWCATPLEQEDVCCPNCGSRKLIIQPGGMQGTTIIPPNGNGSGMMPPSGGIAAKQNEAKKVNTPVVVAGIAAGLLIIAAVIFILVWNSPTNRVDTAAKYIHQCEFEKAQKRLGTLETQTADNLRNYIECAKTVENYRASFHSDSSTGDLKWNDMADITIAAINNFGLTNDVGALPDVLQQDYRYFQEVAEQLASDMVTTQMLTQTQMVFYNPVLQNRQETYTMKELQENINTSNSAITDLSSAVRNIPALDSNNPELTINLLEKKQYAELVEAGSAYIMLIQKAQAQCEQQQKNIDNNLQQKEWTMESELFLPKRNPNYEYSFERYLDPIGSQDDMYGNAQIMLKILKVDLLAYYLQQWKLSQ